MTVLADFESAAVAADITDARDVLASDCALRRTAVPARGRGALELEIGATKRGASVACDLTFREALRFRQPQRVATFCWLNKGEMEVGFRVRDARNQLFETPSQSVRRHRRWVQVVAELDPRHLRRVSGNGPLTAPVALVGYRVQTRQLGKQTIFLDDLQVEHSVAPRDLVRGELHVDAPARIYPPNATVGATVVLENQSRRRALDLRVDLAWIRPDGTVLQRQSGKINLPAAGMDYRSYQTVDFSQSVREPGLYQLRGRARAAGWTAPTTFDARIAVTPTSGTLARGTSTFFGLRVNSFREPGIDRILELQVARDIGANLVALEVPWRRIEPKAGAPQYAALDALVDVLAAGDVAAMLVLTELPTWAEPNEEARDAALERLLGALASHFGPRLERYQIDADALGTTSVAEQLVRVARLHERVAARRPDVRILPPAIPVTALRVASEVGIFLKDHPEFPLVFEVEGAVGDGLQQFEAFRSSGRFDWQESHLWLHRADPQTGAGAYEDAEAILRYHVLAAAAGVGGLIWYDLRDDDNDPDHPDSLRGLVRRDFSPKTSLLGYANAATRLTGYRYIGPAAQTTDAFDSALFLGGNRHVCVVLPRPNRVLPAALAVFAGLPGELKVQDFERRGRPVLESRLPPLAPLPATPIFVTLSLRQPESRPMLWLAEPWLRAPGTIFCGTDTEFTVELDALISLERSYWQLQLPRDLPVESSFSAGRLRAEAGDTLQQQIRLTPAESGDQFERGRATLRVSLEGSTLELPLDVRPLTDVAPASGGAAALGNDHRCAVLRASGGRRGTAEATVYCAYAADSLHLAVAVEDDLRVPFQDVAGEGPAGDQLLIGAAREAADRHIELRLAPADSRPRLEAVHGTPAPTAAACTCSVDAAPAGNRRMYRITIPARLLGDSDFQAGHRLRLAVRYVDDDADGFPPAALTWGGGLDGSRTSEAFQWVRLIADRPKRK